MESAKVGKFMPVEDFIIRDELFDAHFCCNIQETIKSPIRRELFKNKIFYITPSVMPPIKDLIQLIELSGGTVEKQRRSGPRILELNAQNPNTYVILTCSKDLHLLIDLARSPKTHKVICSTEYVMRAVMTQKLDIEKHIIKLM